MLIVAIAPVSVGSTEMTLPIWVPRYVTLDVAYRPPERGSSAFSSYWPMPSGCSDGIRR
jgi:hypothetical protein